MLVKTFYNAKLHKMLNKNINIKCLFFFLCNLLSTVAGATITWYIYLIINVVAVVDSELLFGFNDSICEKCNHREALIITNLYKLTKQIWITRMLKLK